MSKDPKTLTAEQREETAAKFHSVDCGPRNATGSCRGMCAYIPHLLDSDAERERLLAERDAEIERLRADNERLLGCFHAETTRANENWLEYETAKGELTTLRASLEAAQAQCARQQQALGDVEIYAKETAVSKWKEYKTGRGDGHANPYTEGESDMADQIASHIAASRKELGRPE